MIKIRKDIFVIAKLASYIASDNFHSFELLIKKSKINKISPLKIYEMILQSYLFCGFPATIESMKIFKKHFTDFNYPKSKYYVSKFRKIGEANCKLIYKKNYKKLIENMYATSPDLIEWMIIEGYGKVLGRHGLDLLEREFINVAILTTRFYENQLLSHIYGCLNLNAGKDVLLKLIKILKETAGKENVMKCINLLNQVAK